MKKTLMVMIPFMTLLGGYISCSDIYYEPWYKAGVTYELFVQLWIYFFQGIICKFANMSNKINFISVSISLIGSLIVMFIWDFLGIELKILILGLSIIMYWIGYKLYGGIDGLIRRVKIKFTT
jgi:hypothetical protein